MIRVGVAGVGFMGWIHWLAYQRVSDIEVAAICTRDEKKLAGDWTGIQGNFGPPGEQVDLGGITCYRQIDELLNDPNIDLIDVCLPPHFHADVSIRALQAGKHVFCEKPLALTAEDCDRMTDAATQAGKQLFVGHVLPYFPEYQHARSLIASGEYGKPIGGSFKRIISDPTWLKDFYDPQRVGGPLVDLHVHDAHLIRLLFGMPREVVSQGRMRGEVVEFCHTLFRFDDPSLVVHAVCGVINQQGRPFTHGFEIQLENAVLQFEFAALADGKSELMPLKLLSADGKTTWPDIGDADPITAFQAEFEEAAACIVSGKRSEILDGALARDAIVLCHQQTQSVKASSEIE